MNTEGKVEEHGIKLREAISRAKLTNDQICAKVGCSRRTLSNWRSGSRPNDYAIGVLSDILKTNLWQIYEPHDDNKKKGQQPTNNQPGEALANISNTETQNAEEEEEMKRRQLLKIGFMGLAVASAPQSLANPEPWERLSRLFARTSSVDSSTLNLLEATTNNYWLLRATVTSSDLFDGVIGHLKTGTQLLQNSLTPNTRERLCCIIGEICLLAGQLAFDINTTDHSSAYKYYKMAIEAAKEGQNLDLYAVGLGRLSLAYIDSNEAQNASVLLEHAQRIPNNTPTIRAWLSAIQAESYAHATDTMNSEQALAIAEEVISKSQSNEDRYWTGFDQARLEGYKGVCYLKLQIPDKAIQSFHRTLSLTGPTATRHQSRTLSDMASAYALQGNLDEGCRLAVRALELIQHTKSTNALRRLQNFRQLVDPWSKTPEVRALDERLILA